MFLRISAICFLLIIIPGLCFAEEVNSPTALYNEVQRGRDETIDSLSNIYLAQILDNVAKVISENQRKKTDTDAFYLGVDYSACLALIPYLDNDKLPKTVYHLAKKNFKYYYQDMQDREKNLGIDNNTLATLLDIHDRNYFVETLKEWDTKSNDSN